MGRARGGGRNRVNSFPPLAVVPDAGRPRYSCFTEIPDDLKVTERQMTRIGSLDRRTPEEVRATTQPQPICFRNMPKPQHPKAGLVLCSKLLHGLSSFSRVERRVEELPTPNERGGASELYALDHGNDTTWRLTTLGTAVGGAKAPRVPPNGTRVAFQVRRGSDYEIHVMPLAGDPASTSRSIPSTTSAPPGHPTAHGSRSCRRAGSSSAAWGRFRDTSTSSTLTGVLR